MLLQLSWLREFIREWKLNKLLKNIGIKSLHNISITDGTDDKVFIEHLILTSNNILLLGVKKFQGLIFAAEKIELWTQVIGNKSYKFENPLHHLESDIAVLNEKIENTKIVGKVLFINGSEFPKGKPDNVIVISEIKQLSQKKNASELSQGLLDDWNQLTELADSNNFEQGILIDEGKSSINTFSLLVMILFVSLWLAWRLKF